MKRPLQNVYTESPKWHAKIGDVHALLERVKISEEQSGDSLRLRKLNRILSIHSSTAIEGNCLTLAQVTDVINGRPVWGPPKDIKEVQNAWLAYNVLGDYDPWRIADLLNAHSYMTTELVGESGKFRTVGVAVVRGDGVVMHRGAPSSDALANVPIKRGDVPINVPINDGNAPTLPDRVFILIRANSQVTIERLAHTLGVTDRTIKRSLKTLQDSGKIRRVGSRKTGYWEVVLRKTNRKKEVAQ